MVEPLQMQFAPRSGPIQRLWFCPIRKYIRWTSRISKGMPIFEILTPNGHIEPQGTIRAAASYSRCSTAIISVGIVMYTSSPSYRMKHNTWALPNEREIYKSARPTLGYWPWPAHPAALSALPVTAWLLGYLAGPAWPLACCCVEERC